MNNNSCNYRDCTREKWEHDNHHCLFHSKKIEEKKELFKEEFQAQYPDNFIDMRKGLKFINLDGFAFPEFDLFEHKTIDYEISFRNAIFSKMVSFIGTKFTDKVDFLEARFLSRSMFSEVFFVETVVFDGAKFNGRANFGNAEFMGKTYFGNTEFLNKINFSKTIFSNKVDFIWSKFSTQAEFKRTTFLDEANFLFVDLPGEINFIQTAFYNKLNLKELSGQGIINLSYCKFEDCVDLRVKNCRYINLEESVNKSNIDFLPSRNRTMVVNRLNFYNLKNMGNIYIDWQKNNVKNAIENQAKNYQDKANQYRLLKENFRRLGQYDQEDKAYVEFMKNKLLIEKKNKFKYLIKKFIYRDIGMFGTSPGRIAFSMILTVIFFSLVYFLFASFGYSIIEGNDLTNNIIQTNSLLQSCYHSLTTFLTLGWADIHPKNFVGLIISGFEGLLGLFMFVYFVVSFVRKILK